MQALLSIELNREDEQELIALVRWQLHQCAKQGVYCAPKPPKSKKLLSPVASFITLYLSGELKGCIGSLTVKESLWFDVAKNTFHSASTDRRFTPVNVSELDDISFSISLLSPLKTITVATNDELINRLDIGKEGLVIEDDVRNAVFLPSVWQHIDSADEFICALKRKGGWPENYWSESLRFQVFDVAMISATYSQ